MNYYSVLGLKNTASQEEIKAAYKKLVKKYHPDIYSGDKTFAEKKTAEINVAYDVLSNPVTKKEYDDEHFPKYTYTPPQYDFTNKYNNSYNQYSNNYYNRYSNNNYSNSSYKKYSNNYTRTANTYRSTTNYTGTKDGSEHDYSTYVNYERKYTDFHRSKTPNSNYTDSFSSKFEKTVDNMSPKSQSRLFKYFLIFYAIVFIFSIFDVNKIFDTSKPNSNTNNNFTLNTSNHGYPAYSNRLYENSIYEDDYILNDENDTSDEDYYHNSIYDNTYDSSNEFYDNSIYDDTTTSSYDDNDSYPNELYRNSILKKYFTEDQLIASYKRFLNNLESNPEINSNNEFYLTYEEYIEVLEGYLNDYLYPTDDKN